MKSHITKQWEFRQALQNQKSSLYLKELLPLSRFQPGYYEIRYFSSLLLRRYANYLIKLNAQYK